MHTMGNSPSFVTFPAARRGVNRVGKTGLANHRDPGYCRDHGDHEGSDFALAACDRQAKPTLAIVE